IRFDLRRKEESGSRSYGSFALGTRLVGTSVQQENGESTRVFHMGSKNFDIELYPETAGLVVDIAAHLQERIKTLDLSHGVQSLKKLRQRGQTESRTKAPEVPGIQINDESGSEVFFKAIYSLDVYNIQIAWNMASAPSTKSGRRPDDLVFSIKRVELSNKKRNAAKLRIEDMQLQMVPDSIDRRQRSLTSALLPEVVFNVAYTSTGKDVRVAFQAAGKSLDLRATSDFILPA
ncbi:Macrophage colony-stimulating factor 1 receptor, partial [Elasticomyces elasticus]